MARSLRILVVGMSCAGKTTLAQKLSTEFNIDHLDLDDIGWLPNWVQRPTEDFQHDLQQFVNDHDSWVISGNYGKMSNWISWNAATHIVWLNFSKGLLLRRYFTRTYTRISRREKVCGDNVETLYNCFFSEEPLLPWIWKQYKPLQRKLNDLKVNQYQHKTWLEVHAPAEVPALVSQLQLVN